MDKHYLTLGLHANPRGFSIPASFGFNSRIMDRIYIRLGYQVSGFKGLCIDLWFLELLEVYTHISNADSRQISTNPVHEALYSRRFLEIVQLQLSLLTTFYASLQFAHASHVITGFIQASSLAFEPSTSTKL